MRTAPGMMALTRMPNSPYSTAAERTSARIPAFAAAYADVRGTAPRPAADDVQMTDPPARGLMTRTAARTHANMA